MTKRFRRLRKTETLRSLVRETRISGEDLIQPFFVIEGENKRESISSMPGIDRLSVDLLLSEIGDHQKLGGRAAIFFGVPSKKDSKGSQAFAQDGIVQKAIRAVKKEFPDFLIITDICLCSYMDHGHCGVLENGIVDNDKTIALLGKIAVSHAQAGSDIVAPSDMMDFRVRRIREDLDKSGFAEKPILSYAAKYASAFYVPFRDAADSAPQSGDRKSYQMDPANKREALKEARQDVEEGADLVMVKPALAYLDVIALLKSELNVPVVAYNVSGEYSMVKAAAQNGWVDEKGIVLETLTAIKRAGADIILTYHAKDVLKWNKVDSK